MEKILYIAGGIWQKPWLKFLKDKGHYVAVVNPVETETTQLADLHIKADINDAKIINEKIPEVNPSLVTSDQSDVSTMIVAKLAEQWNLPANPVSAIEKLSDKFEIYKFAKALGVPVPKSSLAFSAADVQEFGLENGFPIIIKPTDSTMSRGFLKIRSSSEINQFLFEKTKAFSKSGHVIVQSFVEGDMLTLDGICSGGKHRTIAVSKKDGYFTPGINTGFRYPYNSPLMEQIIKENDRYIERSGMRYGLTHSEYIIDRDKFCLMEIGGRGGGAGITNKIVPWVTGIDVYELFYRSMRGEALELDKLDVLQRSALLRYYTKEQLENFDDLKGQKIRELDGVADFNYNFSSKQYINDSSDIRHSMAIYLKNSSQELDDLENRITGIIGGTL